MPKQKGWSPAAELGVSAGGRGYCIAQVIEVDPHQLTAGGARQQAEPIEAAPLCPLALLQGKRDGLPAQGHPDGTSAAVGRRVVGQGPCVDLARYEDRPLLGIAFAARG